jgi:hypothetical protein
MPMFAGGVLLSSWQFQSAGSFTMITLQRRKRLCVRVETDICSEPPLVFGSIVTVLVTKLLKYI